MTPHPQHTGRVSSSRNLIIVVVLFALVLVSFSPARPPRPSVFQGHQKGGNGKHHGGEVVERGEDHHHHGKETNSGRKNDEVLITRGADRHNENEKQRGKKKEPRTKVRISVFAKGKLVDQIEHDHQHDEDRRDAGNGGGAGIDEKKDQAIIKDVIDEQNADAFNVKKNNENNGENTRGDDATKKADIDPDGTHVQAAPGKQHSPSSNARNHGADTKAARMAHHYTHVVSGHDQARFPESSTVRLTVAESRKLRSSARCVQNGMQRKCLLRYVGLWRNQLVKLSGSKLASTNAHAVDEDGGDHAQGRRVLEARGDDDPEDTGNDGHREGGTHAGKQDGDVPPKQDGHGHGKGHHEKGEGAQRADRETVSGKSSFVPLPGLEGGLSSVPDKLYVADGQLSPMKQYHKYTGHTLLSERDLSKRIENAASKSSRKKRTQRADQGGEEEITNGNDEDVKGRKNVSTKKRSGDGDEWATAPAHLCRVIVRRPTVLLFRMSGHSTYHLWENNLGPFFNTLQDFNEVKADANEPSKLLIAFGDAKPIDGPKAPLLLDQLLRAFTDQPLLNASRIFDDGDDDDLFGDHNDNVQSTHTAADRHDTDGGGHANADHENPNDGGEGGRRVLSVRTSKGFVERPVCFENLIAGVSSNHFNHRALVVRMLHNTIGQRATPTSLPKEPHVVFISRNHPSVIRGRRIANERAMFEALNETVVQETGSAVQYVQMETLSYKQQVALAARTNIMLSPHGGGVANCIWMRPGSVMVEFVAPIGKTLPNMYHTMCGRGGVRHFHFLADPDPSDKALPASAMKGNARLFSNMAVPPEKIVANVKKALGMYRESWRKEQKGHDE